MNDERDRRIESKLRAALGHLESQTPPPPPLPNSASVSSRRPWAPSTVATAALITVLLAVPLFLWLRPDDTASRGTPTTSDRTTRQDTLPYFGLDLEGWNLVIASEYEAECPSDPDQPALGLGRNVSYSRGDTVDNPSSVIISTFIPNEGVVANPCSSLDFPTSLEDLRPPADLPYVIDHGVIAVMGHEAQVIEEHGSFFVTWFLDDYGSNTRLIVGSRTDETVLTVDEVIGITAGIVEITEEQWLAMLAETSGTNGAGSSVLRR